MKRVTSGPILSNLPANVLFTLRRHPWLHLHCKKQCAPCWHSCVNARKLDKIRLFLSASLPILVITLSPSAHAYFCFLHKVKHITLDEPTSIAMPNMELQGRKNDNKVCRSSECGLHVAGVTTENEPKASTEAWFYFKRTLLSLFYF